MLAMKKIYGFVLFLIIIVAGIIVFRFLLLDQIVKSRIARNGEEILGAKVDIGDLRLSLRNHTMDLYNVQIGDRNNPMRNLASFKHCKLTYDTSSVLRFHYLIDTMNIDDLRFATKRATLAVVMPGKTQGTTLPSLEELKKYYSLGQISKRLHLNDIVDLNSLKTFEKLNQSSSAIKLLPETVNQQIASTNIPGKLENIQSRWDRISRTSPQSLQEYTQYYQQLDRLNSDIRNFQTTITTLNYIVKNDFKKIEKDITQVKLQSRKDIATIKNKVSLAQSTVPNLFNRIIGEKYMAYIDSVKQYNEMYREVKKRVKQRKPGVIEKLVTRLEKQFLPVPGAQPKFLIKTLNLSGQFNVDSLTTENYRISFNGVIKEVTSDQDIRNIPTTFVINSVRANVKGTVRINGFLDYRKNRRVFHLAAASDNLPLAKRYWDPTYIPFDVASGKLIFRGLLDYANGSINSNVVVKANNADFVPSGTYDAKNTFHQILYAMLSSTKDYRINIRQDGKKVFIDTNLDALFQRASKGILQVQAQKIKGQLSQQWDKEVAPKINELESEYQSIQKQVNSNYNRLKNEWNAQVNNVFKQVQKKKSEIQGEILKQKPF
ncbi:MAG: hypothetical protein DKM50_00635 [Candidatus Margulisiibacteriota bacterium]|nr:MAG: hypothetical protein DKM50_00635 [Candidatus Margulisiibacteriota bacterium]HCY36364.1 hypothetical protein [Candidatus Margulisiibacteriota bacterium]